MKFELNGKEASVTLRSPTFANAVKTARDWYDLPPVGYRLDRTYIKRRSHSGQKMELRLVFMHVDRRVPAMTESEAYELFADEERKGVA